MDLPPWIDPADWADLLEHRRRMKASNTDRAFRILIRELETGTKRGWAVPQMVDEIVSRNWRGFKAEWLPARRAALDAGQPCAYNREDGCPLEWGYNRCGPCKARHALEQGDEAHARQPNC